MGVKVKVSVIIPVYNVDKYLKRCLDSVINQTLKDIEIIILNDGSTDNSEEIILEYASQDERIQYYKHKNIGLGPTRNKGIEYAKGEYLSFIDSDDYVSLHMLETLYTRAKKENADVVCGQVLLEYENGYQILRQDFCNILSYSLKTQGREKFIREYYFGRKFSHNAWDKIYKTKMIKENKIKFGDNNRIFAEDNFFQLQVLQYANIISFVSQNLYYYIQRDNSIMNSYKKNLINRNLNMILDYEKQFVIPSNNNLNKKICSLLTFEILIAEILNVINSRLGFKTFYNSINQLKNNKVFKKQMNYLISDKAYRFEPNKQKRVFIWSIAILMKIKAYFLVACLFYLKYRYFR